MRPPSKTTIRSAIRTVEKRWEMSRVIFPYSQVIEAFEYFIFSSRIERRRRFVKNQHLRVAKISARQCDALPFSSRKIDARLKTPPQHLIVSARQLCHNLVGQRLLSRHFDRRAIVQLFDAPHSDVFRCRHFVPHEVLEDDADLVAKTLNRVFAQINAVEQDLAFRWIVQPADQLNYGGFALPVLSNQSDALARFEAQVKTVENATSRSRIPERDISKFKSSLIGRGAGSAFGFERTVGFMLKNASRSVR